MSTLFLTLGMLHYKESENSDIVLKAPLILLPVSLDRKSARAGYALSLGDDDATVNPSLREYLKRSFGIALPELPPSDVMPDDYDLGSFFEEARRVVAVHPGWAVMADMYIGLFSFQKLVMYKDLDANGSAFLANRLMQGLVAADDAVVVGLPTQIREMNLDESFPPEKSSHVVDADSSQLRALAAVDRGHDLVIEGPPGTGKSQTITNLIAQALASDKTVLFVAEKMAALKVVHDRLVRAGLGDFCLELHSTRAKKRAVMQSLASALDATLQPKVGSSEASVRLPQVRHSLNQYVSAVHAPSGTLGISPYRALGELETVIHAPRITWLGETDGVSLPQLEEGFRNVSDVALHAQQLGNPSSSPWRDATKTFYSPNGLEEIADQLLVVRSRLLELQGLAETAAAAVRMSPPSVDTQIPPLIDTANPSIN